jgi:hypothetical protein
VILAALPQKKGRRQDELTTAETSHTTTQNLAICQSVLRSCIVKFIAPPTAIIDKKMQTDTITRNERIASIIEYEAANHTAIGEAFRIIAAENDLEVSAEAILCFAVWILLEEGFDVNVERVRCLASKRAIGLNADQAIEAIMEDDDLHFVAGRVELVNGKAAR